MGKAIQLGGYFLLGVSCCGLFSYTAYVVPRFQYYAFWLVVVVSLLFVVAGLADDFLAEAIGVDICRAPATTNNKLTTTTSQKSIILEAWHNISCIGK